VLSTAPMTVSIVTSDANFIPAEKPGLFERVARHFLQDKRDVPFLALSVSASLTVIPFAVALYWPGVFRWWLAPIYLALVFGVFVDRFILMLHNTSHRPLFKKKYRIFANYIPWVLGPFFGESPETYAAHHIGMHHPENNLKNDLSSTMPYRRDRFGHFMIYFWRFFLLAVVELSVYFYKRDRFSRMRRMLIGELGFYAFVVALCYVNWQATLTVFIIPFVAVRFLMMCGNWGQHAFVDREAPENCYRNSITCINTRYNRRCFNDGYHIGHHVRASMHWTEMPVEFEKNIETYVKERAFVFEGIDFFQVWLLLMLKQYKSLARRIVHIDGNQRSIDETVELLKTRLVPIPT
jgi:hypothetical protein